MPDRISIEDWKPLQRNSLRGFARVRTPGGLIFHDVAVHQQNGTRWAMPASKPALTREGTALRRDGKIVYTPIVTFASKELRDRFSEHVCIALALTHPEAFGDGS